MSLLRSLYQRIPIIRELNRIVATSRSGEISHHTHYLRHSHATEREMLLRDIQSRTNNPLALIHFEAQTCSQNGEDGIIQEILRRLGITRGRFLEIGVEDGLENNTHLLLGTGWKGTWIECDPTGCAAIRKNFSAHIASGSLSLIDTAVTPNNIPNIIPPLHVDVASIDIDLNTYHVCEPIINQCSPDIAIIEYNPCFPPQTEWICPYQDHGIWDRSMVYGASLKSYELLMRRLGYSLVGCDFTGNNAFFVRSALVTSDRFSGPFHAETHYQPARFHLTGRRGNAHRLAALPPFSN